MEKAPLRPEQLRKLEEYLVLELPLQVVQIPVQIPVETRDKSSGEKLELLVLDNHKETAIMEQTTQPNTTAATTPAAAPSAVESMERTMARVADAAEAMRLGLESKTTVVHTTDLGPLRVDVNALHGEMSSIGEMLQAQFDAAEARRAPLASAKRFGLAVVGVVALTGVVASTWRFITGRKAKVVPVPAV